MEDFNSKYSGAQVEEMLDQIANGEIGEGQTNLQVKITYAELIALRDDKKLVGGVEYRIVDYETTTTQDATQAMGHPFDIIVSALSESSLSEKAKATYSERDSKGYFASAAISSWEIDYCLDNDKARFGWADEANGKGVIFRMVDEFGNECPYDFKNIMMREGYNSSNETYYYTFDNGGIDYSLNGAKCFSNIIKKYISDSQQINRIVFLCNNREVSDNRFDYQCYNNTMGDARSLHFARECYNNRFEGLNVACNISPKFRNNYVGSESQGLTIGMSCTNNNIGKNNYYVVFEDYVRNCTTGKYTYYSRFGANSSYVIMGADAETPMPYIRRIHIDTGCSYLYIYKDGVEETTYVNDIKVHKGTTGTSSNYLSVKLNQSGVEFGLDKNKNLVQFLSPDIVGKQDKLISGESIKTINGESILGSGDITIAGGGGGGGIAVETDPIFSASPAATITENDKAVWSGKQDAISDLATIRSGAAKGATAVQPEDVLGIVNKEGFVTAEDLAQVATSGSYNDLVDKPTFKTINNESIVGSGNITISGGSGEQGPQGDKGDKGDKGDTGVGVQSVTQTTTSNADGGSNVVTVTLTNGTKSTFTVKNGSKGSSGSNGTNGKDGADGATFTPSVDSAGNLSWTNNKGLTNPPTVNIKGPKGDAGSGGGSGGSSEIETIYLISVGEPLVIDEMLAEKRYDIYLEESGEGAHTEVIFLGFEGQNAEDTVAIKHFYAVIAVGSNSGHPVEVTLNFPDDCGIYYPNGKVPEIADEGIYELSITQVTEYGFSYYNVVVTPFASNYD